MCVVVLLAAVGVCSLLGAVIDLFFPVGEDGKVYIGGLAAETAEMRLRRAIEVYPRGTEIIAVCSDCESEEICRLLQKEHPAITIRREG